MKVSTFLENFGALAEAPNGIAKLRELILQLAVQGKLVDQDPKDEPASILLEKIKAEKEKLIAEGKIKKTKALPPFFYVEERKLFPHNWELVRFGEIFQFIDYRGKTPKKTNSGIKLITAKNVRMGYLKKDPEEFVSKQTYKEWMTRGFPAIDDLLFTTEAPMGNICIVSLEEKFALAQRTINLHPYYCLSSKYLMYAIMSDYVQDLIKGLATGMTAKGIKASRLKIVHIPIPPLAEQKRIVEKVDQLMALCDELEARQEEKNTRRIALNQSCLNSLLNPEKPKEFPKHWNRIRMNFDLLYDTPENVQQLRQSILQLAVQGKLVPQDPNDEPASALLEKIKAEKEKLIEEGKIKKTKALPAIDPGDVPFQLPSGWEWVRLHELLVFGPKNGTSPKSVDYQTNIKSLTLSATTKGVFIPEHFKYLDIEIKKDSHLWLRSGDILIQRSNTPEYVGVSAIYYGESFVFVYPDLMMKIRVNPILDIKFIHNALSCSTMRDILRQQATGTSGSMRKINQLTVNSLPLPLPPLKEQKRIVARVDQLMSLCDKLEESLKQSETKSEQLVESMVHHLSAV